MRRHLIGIIGLLLLLGATALWIWPGEGDSYLALEAAFWRVGAVMAVLWLAYPDMKRLPGWMLGIVPVVLIVLAYKPRRFIYIMPVLLAIALLRPRGKRKG